jgi:hypothetical protein
MEGFQSGHMSNIATDASCEMTCTSSLSIAEHRGWAQGSLFDTHLRQALKPNGFMVAFALGMLDMQSEVPEGKCALSLTHKRLIDARCTSHEPAVRAGASIEVDAQVVDCLGPSLGRIT